jgi:hypothetical protein
LANNTGVELRYTLDDSQVSVSEAFQVPTIGIYIPNPAYGRGLNGVIINSIGLGNAAVPLPADGIFLERVSNDTRSPIYDSNYPAGLYVYAQHSSDISGAFGQIASEILRLAK